MQSLANQNRDTTYLDNRKPLRELNPLGVFLFANLFNINAQ